MTEDKRYRLPTAEVEEAEEALAARWLEREAGRAVEFSAGEEARARDVVRRLRLAERLLTDVLGLDVDAAAADACRMEHVLSAGTADALCTLLGHPRVCPHGSPVPRGGCCDSAGDRLTALLKPLEALKEGEEGRVAYLLSPDSPDAARLLSMGLVPGTKVRLEQRRPAYVVAAGANTVAMEPEVAAGIFVRVGGTS